MTAPSAWATPTALISGSSSVTEHHRLAQRLLHRLGNLATVAEVGRTKERDELIVAHAGEERIATAGGAQRTATVSSTHSEAS